MKAPVVRSGGFCERVITGAKLTLCESRQYLCKLLAYFFLAMTGENECRDSDFIVDVEVAPGVDPVINLEVGMAFTRVVTDDDVHVS